MFDRPQTHLDHCVYSGINIYSLTNINFETRYTRYTRKHRVLRDLCCYIVLYHTWLAVEVEAQSVMNTFKKMTRISDLGIHHYFPLLKKNDHLIEFYLKIEVYFIKCNATFVYINQIRDLKLQWFKTALFLNRQRWFSEGLLCFYAFCY